MLVQINKYILILFAFIVHIATTKYVTTLLQNRKSVNKSLKKCDGASFLCVNIIM